MAQVIDANAEYRPLDGNDPQSIAASIRDFQTALLSPLWAGRTDKVFLTAATFPYTLTFDATGRKTAPASASTEEEMHCPTRIVSVELWNFDATNALKVELPRVSRRPMYLPPNSYYSMDLNAPGELVVRLVNVNAATVDYQVKVNGI